MARGVQGLEVMMTTEQARASGLTDQQVDRIRKEMAAKGVTITELAKLVGVSQPLMSQVLGTMRKRPSLGLLERIHAALGLEPPRDPRVFGPALELMDQLAAESPEVLPAIMPRAVKLIRKMAAAEVEHRRDQEKIIREVLSDSEDDDET